MVQRLSGSAGRAKAAAAILRKGALKLERDAASGATRRSPRGRPARRAAAAARSGGPRPRTSRATAHRRARRAQGPAPPRPAAGRGGRGRSRALGRPFAGLGQQERHLERAPPGRQRATAAAPQAHRRAARKTGERKRGLGLDAAAREDAAETLCRLLDTGLPQDRLADSGLAGQDERRRALLDLGQERLDRAKLLVAPDDLTGHRNHTSAVSSSGVARRAASSARRTPSLR